MAQFQSSNKWLPLLPYKLKLYEECDAFLNSILQNIALSIRRRDLKVSGSFYISQLQRYYNLFHLRFSKETHIRIIHLLLEVISVANLELVLVLRTSSLLTNLLKKKKLLSRDDLQIQWRPLYHLWRFIDYSTFETCGLIYVPSDSTKHMKNLVKACRSYFPIEATREMMEEWRPWLCPYDTKMHDALTMMEIFLPTDLPPELAKVHGYGLWLDEILRFLVTSPSRFGWHSQILTLLARLSWDMCGHISWNSYLDVIFSDLLCAFSIPVGTSQLNVTVKGNAGEPETLAFFVAALLGPHGDGLAAFKKLQRLCDAVATHLHPSNSGKWQQAIVSFIDRFTQLVALRWRRENHSSEEKAWWFDYTPSHARLTKDNLESIANLLLPLAECATFSKSVSSDLAVSPMVNLLQLCPHVVMPTILANLESSLENLTEPHRLYSCLRVASSAAVYLAADKATGENTITTGLDEITIPPLGRRLVVPLLLSLLPGLDPNDLRKTYLCGQILALIVMQVPLVDCSQVASMEDDSTTDELRQSTSQFEEFITSFMDKFFQLVEAIAHSSLSSGSPAGGERQSIEEQALEEGLTPLLSLIVGQADESLKQVAVDYLFRWVIEHRLDATTSGRIIAKLCQATASSSQIIYVKRFVPFLIDKLEDMFKERPNLVEEEKLDNDVLWFLSILSQSCNVDGLVILPYLDRMVSILRQTLMAKCRKASGISVAMLRHLIKAFSRIYAEETSSLEHEDRERTKAGCVSYWGHLYRLCEVNITWHVPTFEELTATKVLIDSIMLPSISYLESYANGDLNGSVKREVLEQHIRVVRSFVRSLGPYLPFWTEADCESDSNDAEKVDGLIESAVALNTWPIFAGYDLSTTSDLFKLKGSNLRRTVLHLAHRLVDQIRTSHEDYTKPLCETIGLIESVLLDGGQQKSGRTDTALRVNDMMSRYMQPFLPERGQPRRYHRLWLIDRVDVQHQNLTTCSRPRKFTKLHYCAMLNLFRLSMHTYSEVRKASQNSLHNIRAGYAYSYRCILDPLCQVLETGGNLGQSLQYAHLAGDGDSDNQLKGALYDILGTADQCLVTKRSWSVLNKLLPLLVELKLPEKPSLQDLIDQIVDRFDSTFETFSLNLKHPDSLIDAAIALKPDVAKDEFDAFAYENRINASCLASYAELNSKLASILANPALPSRSLLIGLDFFRYLLRYDYPCPPELVKIVLDRITGDTPQEVSLCVDALLSICRQIRRRPEKIEREHPKSNPISGVMKLGERPDNIEILYDPLQPKIETAEQWNSQLFVDKTYLGFPCWSSKVKLYTGGCQLEPFRDEKEMCETERLLFAHFCKNHNADASFFRTFIQRLVHQIHTSDSTSFFWKTVYIFKTLLRNFYLDLLDPVLDEIDSLITDETPSSAPASQATAAELFGAVIRAMKFWPFEVMNKASSRLLLSLEQALKNMTSEWEDSWISCFSTVASFSRIHHRFRRLCRSRTTTKLRILRSRKIQNQRILRAFGQSRPGNQPSQHRHFRCKHSGMVAGDLDPKRIHWLFSWLYNDWVGTGPSSVSERSAAAEATRIALLQALVEQTEWRAPKMKALIFKKLVTGPGSPYKNVRHRSGQFVSALLSTDPSWFVHDKSEKGASPTWQDLTEELGTVATKWVIELGPQLTSSAQNESTSDSIKQAILTSPEFCRSKLMMEIIKSSLGAIVARIPYCLIDLLATMVSLDTMAIGIDDELRSLALTSSAIIGMGRLSEDRAKSKALEVVSKIISEHSSWQTRRQTLCVLQVSLFHNMYELATSSKYTDHISALLVDCLDDTTVEVREMAAVTLSGLLQCGFLKPNDTLVSHFRNMAGVKIGRIGTANRDIAIRHRHSGVLGLAAVVSAFPYSVPHVLPPVLIDLADHVGDPPPIAATARKALTDFRRTHHDQWFIHREHFNEDQLAVLSSVLVSPNYYA